MRDAEFIREKLKESREAMKEMPIVMPYDNGGGQTGIRENPAFSAYEKLLKSYLAVLTQLGATKDDKQTETKTLSLVGNSKWKKQA